MKKKIELKGNYLYITDVATSKVEQRLPIESTYYNYIVKTDNTYVVFNGLGNLLISATYAVWLNDNPATPTFTNGTTDYTLETLTTFLDANTAGTEVGLNQPLTDTQLRATPVPVSPRANTTGTNGTTPYKLTSLASTNANVVKNSGGNLYSIVAIGLTSTVRYLKIYSKATAPTVGTDVPLMTIPVPANTQGAGVAIPFAMGVNFPLGIGVAITSGSADNDTGAVGAGDVIVNLTYA